MMDNWTTMMGYGVGHWVFFAVIAVIILYPLGRILDRMGLSPLWSVLAFIPLINLIALWALAFADWPRQQGSTSS